MSSPGLRRRLSLMMAGVYAVQGAWWPLLAVHLQDLGITGRTRGWIFATLALSSLLTPLGVGRLADRHFPAQRLLAAIYAVGAGFLLLLATGIVQGPLALFVLFLTYWLLTAPVFGLANTIALRNLECPAEEFGRVRLWGTIAWMGVGWVVAAVMLLRGTAGAGRGVYEAFAVAAALSACLAAFALRLPHTPPLAQGDHTRRLGFSAFGSVAKQPMIALLFLFAFGTCLASPFVYQVVPAYLRRLGLDRAWVAPAMSLGQVLEIAALLSLTRLIGLFGFRGVMGMGLLAWVLYYALLASNPPLALAIAGLPIQGVAIACFHIASMMYIDTHAPPQQRAEMQGLNVMVTSGLGSLLGSLFAGESVARAGGATSGAFLAPMLLDLALFSLFLVAFRPRPRAQAAQELPAALPAPHHVAERASPPAASARPRRKKRRRLAALK